MQKSYFLPEQVNVQLQRPACPKCNTHMMLARIKPARAGSISAHSSVQSAITFT